MKYINYYQRLKNKDMDIDKILERYNQEDLTYNAKAKQAIKEIVKETLRMAAEDAELECRIYEKFAGKYSAENFGQEVCINTDERQYIGIDKDSITNVINKIKF